ncbi:hypothetical protein K503DRAFT_129609 [Rhizopogon vinicolor AM-OR11-026]|uniref:Uncharacterized protein n=1 Tax=Rhizopogon vinicolor AM-OR11-026 TaxID=1314800 RepID=A0A1B7MEL3_9AGAM|nr:hypothetical protein K503DRAFT_129609 [Rhizopogon vinicolor AM-OR11-026]
MTFKARAPRSCFAPCAAQQFGLQHVIPRLMEKVVTPLGGYQYIPVEMAPSGVYHALESWTDCPPTATTYLEGLQRSTLSMTS